jgi:HEAT repeat protein
MLEHLHESAPTPEVLNVPLETFLPMKKANAEQILEAQINTSDWLTELGAKTEDEILTEMERKQVTEAFKDSLVDQEKAKTSLTQIKTPVAVQRLVGMLTAYDWQFVEQAQRIRGMAVAKILEETDHPDARIRLKALEMLGKVTEVGLFTERIEIKKI